MVIVVVSAMQAKIAPPTVGKRQLGKHLMSRIEPITGDDKTGYFGRISEHDQGARADLRHARDRSRSETLLGRWDGPPSDKGALLRHLRMPGNAPQRRVSISRVLPWRGADETHGEAPNLCLGGVPSMFRCRKDPRASVSTTLTGERVGVSNAPVGCDFRIDSLSGAEDRRYGRAKPDSGERPIPVPRISDGLIEAGGSPVRNGLRRYSLVS